jgi:Single-strand binding protein family
MPSPRLRASAENARTSRHAAAGSRKSHREWPGTGRRAPRVEGSGRTVLACPTPSHKPSPTNPAPGPNLLGSSIHRKGQTMTEAAISFAGNLTEQPEVCYTEGGIARAMFRVAVSGRREQGAWFFTVVVWRGRGHRAAPAAGMDGRRPGRACRAVAEHGEPDGSTPTWIAPSSTTWRPSIPTGSAKWLTCGSPRAGANQAFPLDDRSPIEIITTPRPVMAPPRERYTYYPDVADVPESQAVNIRNRSYTIGALVDIPGPAPRGCSSPTARGSVVSSLCRGRPTALRLQLRRRRRAERRRHPRGADR